MSGPISFNRLKDEKSAYLLQHKDNPVHWWAYGPEALQKARDLDLPIFLSIGYSSCHWCHVMAHESFENEEIAATLNQNFICIKVDKEEFPDIDAYYQQACQLFTRSGGWPLSAFLLPDLRPFFVGTYFPPATRGQMSGLPEVLQEIIRSYKEDRDKITATAVEVQTTLAKGLVENTPVEFQGRFPNPSSILGAVKEFQDNDHGGYGSPPKFPHFAFYEWAIEQMLEGMAAREQGEHIVKTIEHMLMGGMYDHARGGIHRYATDQHWMVPHFEKMLYDQAGLLKVLSKISLLYPSPLVFDAMIQTLDYLENEMFSEEQYFFTAQDADSEGVEGLYFAFNETEFEDAINEADENKEENSPDLLAPKMAQIKQWFAITAQGNFESNLNVIGLSIAHKNEIFTREGWELVRKTRRALLDARKTRIPPATDPKGLASWNFMLLSALADVIQYCQIDVIKRMASTLMTKALEGQFKTFILAKDAQKMILRHSTTRKNSLPYLEDYVFFAEAQLRTYEVTGNKLFKENFYNTLQFIAREFIDKESGSLLTRAGSSNDQELYPNQKMTPFDSSHRSPASTYLLLCRRAAVLFGELDLLTPVEKLKDEMIHFCLKNPINSGEALRALIYPDEAYRVVKVPIEWLKEDAYVNFLPYFLPRFVLDYVADAGDMWQICTLGQCELQGKGLKEFIQSLSPKQPAEDKA